MPPVKALRPGSRCIETKASLTETRRPVFEGENTTKTIVYKRPFLSLEVSGQLLPRRAIQNYAECSTGTERWGHKFRTVYVCLLFGARLTATDGGGEVMIWCLLPCPEKYPNAEFRLILMILSSPPPPRRLGSQATLRSCFATVQFGPSKTGRNGFGVSKFPRGSQ